MLQHKYLVFCSYCCLKLIDFTLFLFLKCPIVYVLHFQDNLHEFALDIVGIAV